ncbi:MAG TPA: signal peptidase I [Rectinemataceae bacterium]|nr:signal peptidase I [Rectinemataceae bacterium]
MLVSIPDDTARHGSQRGGVMFAGKRRTYAEAVESRRRLGSRLLLLLLVFVSYQVVSGVFVAAYSVGSVSMAPTLQPRDLILATPLSFGARTIFGKLPAFGHPERGDIVLAEPPFAPRRGFWVRAADSFVRFVTFQRLSLLSRGYSAALAGPMVERVVGLPGDSIEMDNFVFRVKPAGSEHFLTEFELASARYDISKTDLVEGWKDSFPASGTMALRVLGKDEYFLAGDARGASSDSRLWGPVKMDRLVGKLLLRYWPPARFGVP